MAEDMTYPAEPTRAQLAVRVQELEESREFWRTAALDWKARWEAVPVDALLFWYDPFAPGATLTSESVAQAGAAIDAWVLSVRKSQDVDDTDAPLTLAAIDEDGDE